MGRARNNNNSNNPPPPPPPGGGVQQKLKIGESAGSAAATQTHGRAQQPTIAPPPPRLPVGGMIGLAGTVLDGHRRAAVGIGKAAVSVGRTVLDAARERGGKR